MINIGTKLGLNNGTLTATQRKYTKADVDFSQNTDAKVKLPSGGGIYESDGSTEILTESSGSVTLKNTAIDSSVTYPNGVMFNFKKSIVTGGSMTTGPLPYVATTHGSHSHQFKTTDAQVVITCVSSIRLYEDNAAAGVHDLNGVFSLRHSLDSYASNLVSNGLRILDYGNASYNNKTLSGSVVFQWIYAPTRSVNDTITYKIYATTTTNLYSFDTNSAGSNVIWTSYEVKQ
jgi:hypothetical protein